MDELTERFDGLMKSWIKSLAPVYERRVTETLRSHYVHLKKIKNIERHSPRLSKETVRAFSEERKRPYAATKRENHRVLSAETDLSYLSLGCPVGSYNPDEEVELPARSNDPDCVRCLCGITEDDGKMVLCESCNYWMHASCVGYDSNSDEEFKCLFCEKSLKHTPAIDIVLNPQPEVSLPDCTYYRTLVNSRGLQVRINEAVYVERLINDDYKSILKRMHEEYEECVQTPKKRGRKNLQKNDDVSSTFIAS